LAKILGPRSYHLMKMKATNCPLQKFGLLIILDPFYNMQVGISEMFIYMQIFNTEGDSVFLDRLQFIFENMDQQYARAAAHYGFNCSGCRDNCCRTRFYHHTHIEYLFMLTGYRSLDLENRRALKARAAQICHAGDKVKKDDVSVPLMCPLNVDDLCSLYAYRPMICRLHGIPHELRKPGQKAVFGPGCITFDQLCAHKSYHKFDRTGFYLEMARLEKEYKTAASLSGKIKMTIAEMIQNFPL